MDRYRLVVKVFAEKCMDKPDSVIDYIDNICKLNKYRLILIFSYFISRVFVVTCVCNFADNIKITIKL